MNLPDLPNSDYVLAVPADTYEKEFITGHDAYSEHQLRAYGSECYAKGRADLLKEIGEPVAWLDENGFPKHINNLRLIAKVWKPLYVLPKEKACKNPTKDLDMAAFYQRINHE